MSYTHLLEGCNALCRPKHKPDSASCTIPQRKCTACDKSLNKHLSFPMLTCRFILSGLCVRVRGCCASGSFPGLSLLTWSTTRHLWSTASLQDKTQGKPNPFKYVYNKQFQHDENLYLTLQKVWNCYFLTWYCFTGRYVVFPLQRRNGNTRKLFVDRFLHILLHTQRKQ